MKVLVCGGREFDNIAFIWRELDKLHEARPISEMITGGARGVDTIANDWAKTKPIKRYVSRPDYKKYPPKVAPRRRNEHMLTWKPDLVVAFPGGPGTAHMTEIAVEAGVEVLRVGISADSPM